MILAEEPAIPRESVRWMLGIYDYVATAIDRFIHGDVFKDIPNLPAADVVVLSSVLEHLDTCAEFLGELTKRFHPKKFLIRVPTLERTHYVALKRELGLSPFLDRTHVLEYSPAIFAEEMEKAGLIIISQEIRWGDIWAECIPRS
jgi:hypothetical protein